MLCNTVSRGDSQSQAPVASVADALNMKAGTADNGEAPFPDLSEFGITRNAFLPAKSPVTSLSDSYYEPWEYIAHNLPSLIDNDYIRDVVRELPVLSTNLLESEVEWQRAYVLLGFMAQAYIWGGDNPEPRLPPQITVPLLAVSAHLEVQPTLTYAGANLWNFSCPSSDFSLMDELKLHVSFTGSESESWFLLISVPMEAKAAGVLPTMIRALEAVKVRDYDTITSALGDLRVCIDDVRALLGRVDEKCDPMMFYHRIRPFFAGSMNMASAGLPNGVYYDEGAGRGGSWRQYSGGNNGQSALIQFFDAILGVQHADEHGAGGRKAFHVEVREYMPGPHRRLLEHIARMGSIRDLVLEEPISAAQHRLREAYTAATDALSALRDRHIQIVARYVIVPSRKPWTGKSRKNLASSSSTRKPGVVLMGTGGTKLMPFLRTSRDETRQAGKLMR
ncbi:hypothetical protein E4U42_004674 [Claviceps africana]|uniref:Indoleamine 2,3-dioxygenase n=1 Tax=Claviceps africana TaxID=83212 RepID=A0A8K0JHU0_9HYPO|nr:hypothetical protein E4U42_004674 [Claviceps africana]